MNILSARMKMPAMKIRGALAPLMIFLVLMLVCKTCIIPYDSGVEVDTEIVAVDGSLIKGDSLQTIVLTRSTTLERPKRLALRDCNVKVVDSEGNEFVYTENLQTDGVYERVYTDDELVYNRSYKLVFETPEGKRYESDFEKMLPGVDVDSLYYRVEENLDPITGEDLSGVQFYIDIKASDTISRYFRWKLEESWEYTATAPITMIIYINRMGMIDTLYPDEFALYRCWAEENINEIYLSNTMNLSLNEKKHIPLKYVSTQTNRLRITYSLLVEQYSMDRDAYNFWDQNRIAVQESGGLYNSQPGEPITNIANVNDSTEFVLGYFWTSSVSKRRLTFHKPTGLAVPPYHCDLVEFDWITHVVDGQLPVYIWYDMGTNRLLTAPDPCFDCTTKGGKTVKPDYFDD